jgi:hypothetical protein
VPDPIVPPAVTRFRDPKTTDEYARMAPMLRTIFEDVQAHAFEVFGWAFLVTSIFRTAEEDAALEGTGVHVVGRGIDVRTMDRPASQVAAVTAYANGKFQYDFRRPSKPTAYSAPHGDGPHLHLQTCANTRPRAIIRSA